MARGTYFTRSAAVAVLLALFGPYLVLRLPGVPQAVGRATAAAILLLGASVAIFWFGLKSQMIRPGGKLYQPQFDRVRPKIELGIRILVLTFGAFYFFVLTLPFAEDLLWLGVGRKPLLITRTVMRGRSRSRSPRETIALSDGNQDYQLFYRTKALRVGDAYEFVILPRSRMILDYHESRPSTNHSSANPPQPQ